MARNASGQMPALPEGGGRGKRSRKVSRFFAFAGVGVLAAGISLFAFAPASDAAPKPTPTANATAAQQSNLSVTLRVTGTGYVPNGGSQLRLTDLPRVYGTGYVGCVANNKGDIDCSINTGAPYTSSTIRWEFDDLSGNLTSGPFTADVTPYSAPKNPQVTLCHATPPATAKNGWNELTISADAVFKQGHDNHAADIIPAFVYTNQSGSDVTYPGKNLTTKWSGYTGQQILNNGCALPAPPPSCVTLSSSNVGKYGSLAWTGNSATVTLKQRDGGYCNDWPFDVTRYAPAAFPQTVKQVSAASVGQSGLSATAMVDETSCGQIDGYEGTGPQVGSTLSGPGKDYEANHKFLSQIFGGLHTWSINKDGCNTPPPPTTVTPVPPIPSGYDCTHKNDNIQVPTVEGVLYEVNGQDVSGQTLTVTPGQSVSIQPVAATGYQLDKQYGPYVFSDNLDTTKCNTSSAPPSSSSHVPPTSGSPSTHHNQPPSTSAHPAQGSSTTAAQRAVGAATDMGPPAGGSTNWKALGIALIVIGLLMLGLEGAHTAARRRA